MFIKIGVSNKEYYSYICYYLKQLQKKLKIPEEISLTLKKKSDIFVIRI